MSALAANVSSITSNNHRQERIEFEIDAEWATDDFSDHFGWPPKGGLIVWPNRTPTLLRHCESCGLRSPRSCSRIWSRSPPTQHGNDVAAWPARTYPKDVIAARQLGSLLSAVVAAFLRKAHADRPRCVWAFSNPSPSAFCATMATSMMFIHE